MSTYAQAVDLRKQIIRLAVAREPVVIVLGTNREPVGSDRGPGDYEITVGPNVVLNVESTTYKLATLQSKEAKLRHLAGAIGVMNYEIDAILSTFDESKAFNARMFERWYDQGKPGTHISYE